MIGRVCVLFHPDRLMYDCRMVLEIDHATRLAHWAYDGCGLKWIEQALCADGAWACCDIIGRKPDVPLQSPYAR